MAGTIINVVTVTAPGRYAARAVARAVVSDALKLQTPSPVQLGSDARCRGAVSVLFGDVWKRPGLSVRDRSLVTVAVLAATYRPDQLISHVRLAPANGLTQDELVEALTHLAFYAGRPSHWLPNREPETRTGHLTCKNSVGQRQNSVTCGYGVLRWPYSRVRRAGLPAFWVLWVVSVLG